MRRVFGFPALVMMIAACDLGGGNRASASLLSSSGGEVALADGGTLDFGITSEKFKQWDRAQRRISPRIAARFGEILQPDAPTERSIAAAVDYLDSQPSARRAIENAGMTVRAFVVMTVALEQEMRVASGQGAIREPEPVQYEFPPFDTTFMAPQPLPAPEMPDTLLPPIDTYSRVDTLFPRPLPRDTIYRVPGPTIFRRDTVRRDTAPGWPGRDTVGPSPAPRPVRDSVRDTLVLGIKSLPILPRDSVPRA